MIRSTRKQLIALGMFLAVYALLVALTYLLTPLDQLVPLGQSMPESLITTPRWQLAALNAAIVLAAYGLLGMAAVWFSIRLQLPAIYRAGAGWQSLLVRPMLFGLALGVALVIGDRLFALLGSTRGFPHPAFPLSVLASGAAGIGEEIMFRGFVMGAWAWIFDFVLRRWNGRQAALWISNGLAALAFSALHLPTAMILLNVTSPAAIPAPFLAELFVLNGLMGLVAGELRMRDGLVVAMGLHFWADVVWHVVWPLMGLAAAGGL
jgi:membrane protease YdiL (CAAX protease family)